MAIVVWNGHEIPEELRSLPPGRYVVERLDEVPVLTESERAGIDAALSSLRDGKGIDGDEARRRIEAALRR